LERVGKTNKQHKTQPMAYFATDAKHELNALMLSSLFGYITASL
jgi:hypothetical protein